MIRQGTQAHHFMAVSLSSLEMMRPEEQAFVPVDLKVPHAHSPNCLCVAET
jgi:hypothetical protein